MASPFQQRSLQRKLVYTGLIVALFAASYFWRTLGVEAKADQLALREENRGEVELSGSAIRLYTQHKIMQSDKTATMRSLLQLSMIDPLKRDPEKFWLDSGEGRRGRQVDMVKFEEFCKDNPQLVRRLREGLRAKASNPNL